MDGTHAEAGIACFARAGLARERGDTGAEISDLRKSIAHFSLADDQEPILRQRADSSARLADILASEGAWPEAMQAYQEAVDAFGRIDGCDADASRCAHRIQDGVRALRSRPRERLYLLTARYERELRSLQLVSGTEMEQGDCVLHIADILRRRGRAEESIPRFEEALALYSKAKEGEPARARCFMKLGDLYASQLSDDVKAFSCYRSAERLLAGANDPTEADEAAIIACRARLRELATDLSEITA